LFIRDEAPTEEKAYHLPESARNLVICADPVNPFARIFHHSGAAMRLGRRTAVIVAGGRLD
jgi:hypothetical protein